MKPKLLASYVLFPCTGTKEDGGRRRTYTECSIPGRGRRSERSPRTARECSRSVHCLFIVVLCVFWGIELTQRMRCRRRCWPPTNICTNSGESQMSTWLTTIVCNCARMQLRKRPRQIHTSLDEQIGEEQRYFLCERLADPRPSPEDECRTSELAARLRKCTALLSPSLRRTFQLRVMDGLSIFETAEVLGLRHVTVKARLARARRKLARYMQRAP